jgi:hypothetical protein
MSIPITRVLEKSLKTVKKKNNRDDLYKHKANQKVQTDKNQENLDPSKLQFPLIYRYGKATFNRTSKCVQSIKLVRVPMWLIFNIFIATQKVPKRHIDQLKISVVKILKGESHPCRV